MIQHECTQNVLLKVSTDELKWSLLCVAIMVPSLPKIEPFETPYKHSLVVAADVLPEWRNPWYMSIPIIGVYLAVILAGGLAYKTKLEDVADLLAEDLESGSEQWVGRTVGMKQKEKGA